MLGDHEVAEVDKECQAGVHRQRWEEPCKAPELASRSTSGLGATQSSPPLK